MIVNNKQITKDKDKKMRSFYAYGIWITTTMIRLNTHGNWNQTNKKKTHKKTNPDYSNVNLKNKTLKNRNKMQK